MLYPLSYWGAVPFGISNGSMQPKYIGAHSAEWSQVPISARTAGDDW